MAVPFSEFPENQLYLKTFNKIPKNQNTGKLKKTNPNLKSLWAFLSSILIYIYVFYIFNLSPSTLICTTKFWFFISNTLVLIVAVDFAAFSHHEGHVIKSKGGIIIKEHVAEDHTATLSKCHVIEDVAKDTTATSSKCHVIVHDTTATSSKGEDGAIVPVPFENPKEKIINAAGDHHQKKRQRCARSNSTATAEEEGKAMILHRTLSEKHDHKSLEDDDKMNEFSRMSNEEVNRRVEEFIRRFNRQIRLQAVNNPQNLEIN